MKPFREGLPAGMLLGLTATLLIVGLIVAALHRPAPSLDAQSSITGRGAPGAEPGSLRSESDASSRDESDSPFSIPRLQIPPVSVPLSSVSLSQPIRVNVTPSEVDALTVAVDGPFRIRDIDSGHVLHRGSQLTPTRVTATAFGFRLGERRLPGSRLKIVAGTSPSIWVGNHQYRGEVRLIRRPGNRVIAVNVIPLEDYVAGVVDSEMPAAFPTAARRAQAIVSRTYALYHMMQAPDNADFDVHASTRSQRYLGFQYRDQQGRRLAGESADSRQIARETSGAVCLWRGELFCTYYTAVCGGRTTPGRAVFSDAAPPLQSVACHWCRDAPLYRWTRTLPKTEVAAQLRQSSGLPLRFVAPSLSITRVSGPSYDPFSIFELRTRYTGLPFSNPGQRLTALELRRRLSAAKLPSPRYVVRDVGDSLEFHGRGHGHGVGLCQWGARGLANSGRNERQIIRYYYPGVQLVVLEPDEP